MAQIGWSFGPNWMSDSLYTSRHCNPSKKSEVHFLAEARYSELSTTISRDLCLKKSERPAADYYLEHVMNLLNRFNSESPPL